MKLKKAMRVLVILLTVFANIGCDQATKAVARSTLGDGRVISVLGGTMILRYAENDGAFLGLGSRFPQPLKTIFTLILPILIIAGMIAFLAGSKEMDAVLVMAASCIMGGGASNLMDRILYAGRVSDFMNFGIGSFRVTGILNMADLSITLGCLFFLLHEVRLWRSEKKPRPESPSKE
jgi:signal peptidase II